MFSHTMVFNDVQLLCNLIIITYSHCSCSVPYFYWLSTKFNIVYSINVSDTFPLAQMSPQPLDREVDTCISSHSYGTVPIL